MPVNAEIPLSTADRWARANLAPLWESKTAHKVVAGPPPPVVWRWAMIRPIIGDALAVTSPEVVERRVLKLKQPNALAPDYEATMGNITAGIQALAPGEIARPHRHAMGALRFIIEGSGATTLVDGRPCTMNEGDMVLTPAWCWHEHRHDGDRPVIWLDILDVPIHHHLGTIKFQPGPMGDPPLTFDDALFAQGGILPTGDYPARHSPKFSYTYAEAATALAVTPPSGDGLRSVRYVNPVDGGPAIPFLASRLIQVDDAQFSRPVTSNASRLLLVVSGKGESRIGEESYGWERGDIIALPPGSTVAHRAEEPGSRLFEVSDSDLLARLGLLDEEIA